MPIRWLVVSATTCSVAIPATMNWTETLGLTICKVVRVTTSSRAGAGNDTLAGGLDADTLSGGAGNDNFVFGFASPRTESSQTTIDTILDFSASDKIDLPGINYINGKPLVLIESETQFRTDDEPFNSGDLGMRPGSNPGDGFVDVLWRYSTVSNRIELWVDGNDDGQFSETDIFALLPSNLTGITTLTANNFVDNFVAWRGTAGADTFDSATPSINIDAGNIVYGLAGNDTLSGGFGGDSLYGGTGNDSIDGGADGDYLAGGSGADFLDGGAGNDQLDASGYDTPTTTGSDTAGSVNVLYGGGGNDGLWGGAVDDQLNGQADDDTLEGAAGYDSLTGGDGNDVLRIGATTGANNRGNATDTLIGGAGDDRLITIAYSTQPDAAVLTGGQGADSFEFGIHSNDNFTQQYAWSSVAAPDRITDFNVLEGDVIFTGITNGVSVGSAPLAWRGVAAPGFTAMVGQSLALASGGAIETPLPGILDLLRQHG